MVSVKTGNTSVKGQVNLAGVGGKLKELTVRNVQKHGINSVGIVVFKGKTHAVTRKYRSKYWQLTPNLHITRSADDLD